MLFTGIRDLAGLRDTVEATIDAAGYGITIEHSISGLIPIGKEYYYVGLDTEKNNMYIVRAGKKWLEDNFNQETHFSDGAPVKVKAVIKKVDYEVSKELSSELSSAEGINFVTGISQCYDAMYKVNAVKKLITVALTVAACILLFVCDKTYCGKYLGIITLFTFFAALCMLIHVMTVGM